MATCLADKSLEFYENQVGAWGYLSSNGSGASSVAVSGSKRIQGIRIRADSTLTFNINGGTTIDLRRNEVWVDNPMGNLVDPTINFLSGSWSYTIEYLV